MEKHEGLAVAAELCVTVKSPANNEHALRLFPEDTVLDLQGTEYYIVRDVDGIFLVKKDQFTPDGGDNVTAVSAQRAKDRMRALRILEIAENTVTCIMEMREDAGEGSSAGPEVEAEMEELRKRLESALAQVSELEGAQAEKERLNELIGQRESELEQQREMLQSLEQERDRLALENQSIEGLNAQIREQGERIVEQEKALETLREQAVEQASRIQDLETQLQQRSTELERTRTELEQLKSEIDLLRNRVSRLEEALRSDDPLIREFLLLEQNLEALELATSEMGSESAIPTMGSANMDTLCRGAVASKETEAKITNPNKGKTGKVEPQRVLEIGGVELRVPLGNLCESRQAFYFEHGDETCFIAFLGTTNSHRIVTLKPGGSGISNAVADQVQLLQEVSDPNQRKIICIVIALQTGMNFSQTLKALTPASVAEAAPPDPDPSDGEEEGKKGEEQTPAEAAYQRIEEEGVELICIPYSSVTGFRNSELEDLSFHFGAAKKKRAAVEKAIENMGVSRYLKSHPYAYLNLSEQIGFYLIFTPDYMVAIKTTELGAEHPAMIEKNMTAIPDGPIRNFLVFRGTSALKDHIDPPANPEPDEEPKEAIKFSEIKTWDGMETLDDQTLRARVKENTETKDLKKVVPIIAKMKPGTYCRVGVHHRVFIKISNTEFVIGDPSQENFERITEASNTNGFQINVAKQSDQEKEGMFLLGVMVAKGVLGTYTEQPTPAKPEVALGEVEGKSFTPREAGKIVGTAETKGAYKADTKTVRGIFMTSFYFYRYYEVKDKPGTFVLIFPGEVVQTSGPEMNERLSSAGWTELSSRLAPTQDVMNSMKTVDLVAA